MPKDEVHVKLLEVRGFIANYDIFAGKLSLAPAQDGRACLVT